MLLSLDYYGEYLSTAHGQTYKTVLKLLFESLITLASSFTKISRKQEIKELMSGKVRLIFYYCLRLEVNYRMCVLILENKCYFLEHSGI